MKIIQHTMWMCPNCRESIEAHFRRCWNCGCDDRGNPDPNFVNDSEPKVGVSVIRRSRFANFAWMILAIGSFVGIMAAAIAFERRLPEQWNIRISLTITLLLLCFVMAVAINVASRLYLWLRRYLYESEPDLDVPEIQSVRNEYDRSRKGI